MALRALQGPTGGGSPVGGGGTSSPSTIPRWTGPSTLGDSGLIDNGTAIYTTTRNVGIGTASPGYRLDVANSTASAIARIVTTNAASSAQLILQGTSFGQIDNTVGDFFLTNSSAAGNMIFRTGSSTERARIDSAGRFGIGTASPDSTLHVVGAASTQLRIGYSGLSQNSYDAGDHFFRSAGGSLTRVTINTSGNLILNSANTGATIQAAGTSQGLKLQGTAGTNNTDPNVLDFYADGGTANSGGVTWTPTLTFGGNSTGITYAAQVGRYTRIGNTIIAHCYMQLSSKGTATGNATIGGLPTSSNTSGLYSSASIGYIANVALGSQATALMFPNATAVTMYKAATGANPSNMTDADFANNSWVIFSISYPVT